MFSSFRKILSRAFTPTSKSLGMGLYNYPSEAGLGLGILARAGSYDNNYANITRIAERIATVLPYAVSLEGEKLDPQPKAMNALLRPNSQMSEPRFIKTLATMQLVHPVTYLLVWHWEGNRAVPGGKITPANLAGFTFLEEVTDVRRSNGRSTYQTPRGIFTDQEVIALSLDVNPYAIADGYSPSIAAKRWATVDDYLVDYQAGIFKNGAIPAGQFVITAATEAEFNDIVDELQARHRGAGKNNNVVYSHRPIDPVGGKPLNPSVEWLPFSQSNKELSLKDIFDQAERVRDMDFGVPAEVKGYLQNSNYASATTAEHIFDKYVVRPKLVQMWGDFTHELDRITGGLGFALSFDFDPTALADEQKVVNEAKQVQLNTFLTAVQAGVKAEDAIEALGLPEEFMKMGELTVSPAEPAVAEEVDELPSEDEVEEREEKGPKTKTLEIPEALADDIDPELRAAIEAAMGEQIEAAVGGENYEATDERDKKLAREMLVVMITLMLVTGSTQYELTSATLVANGVELPPERVYAVSERLQASYGEYLQNVARSYNADTADSIRRTLAQANTESWDKEVLAMKLRDIMKTDEWRVQRLARTETHRADGLASLDAMRKVSDETGVAFRKTWHVNPNTPNHCAECLAMDGKSLPLDDPFVSEEENKFADMEMAAAHPNCRCYMTYEIAQPQKSVRLECPRCKRFLAEASDGHVSSLKCQRCKSHWAFDIAGGQVAVKQLSSPLAPITRHNFPNKNGENESFVDKPSESGTTAHELKEEQQ